ncbi:hypothetical protein FISHEDRAFT_54996, partial [Fistulina hepatica ATCC 64428]
MQRSSARVRVPSARAQAMATQKMSKKTSVSRSKHIAVSTTAKQKRKTEASKNVEEEHLKDVRKRTAIALAEETDDEDGNSPTHFETPAPNKKRRYEIPSDEEDSNSDVDASVDGQELNEGTAPTFDQASKDDDSESASDDVEEDELKEKTVASTTFFDNSMTVEDVVVKQQSKTKDDHCRRMTVKLTKNHFTPVTLTLAEKAKRVQRQRICTEEAFPTDKDVFTHKSLRLAAHTGITNEILKDKLKAVEADVERQNNILTYVNYASGGVRGDLKSKAKLSISGHYKIPGTLSKEEVQEVVAWLLSKQRPFIFGGLNILTRSFEVKLMVAKKEVPHTLIALIATAVDAALS